MQVYVRKISSSSQKHLYNFKYKVITQHYVDGVKKTKVIKKFNTKHEAQSFAQDHERQIRTGRDYDFDMSLSEFVDNFIRDWAISHYKTSASAKNVLRRLDRIVLPRLGHKQLDKITVGDWESLWRDMNTSQKMFDPKLPDKPYAYNSILNTYMTVCKIFTQAERLEKAMSPTIWRSELPNREKTVNGKNLRPLKQNEYKEILNYLVNNNDRDYFFFKLMLSTGLRLGEAIALTYRDIEFKTNQDDQKIINLHINKSTDPGSKDANGFYNAVSAKSYASHRVVPIGSKITGEFMKYMDDIAQEKEQYDNKASVGKVVIHKRKEKSKIYYAVRIIDLESDKRKTVASFDTKDEAENYVKTTYQGENIANSVTNYVKAVCNCNSGSTDCHLCTRVFVKADGSQIPYDYYRDKLKRIAKLLMLPPATIHLLRHTHATTLIESDGIPLQSITDRLGHASTDTTTKIYINTSNDYEHEKAKLIDELF
tara:strand:- start:6566 stop:8011 length:1446 start_codon:yes stop_codon:yes gene_type:complete